MTPMIWAFFVVMWGVNGFLAGLMYLHFGGYGKNGVLRLFLPQAFELVIVCMCGPFGLITMICTYAHLIQVKRWWRK